MRDNNYGYQNFSSNEGGQESSRTFGTSSRLFPVSELRRAAAHVSKEQLSPKLTNQDQVGQTLQPIIDEKSFIAATQNPFGITIVEKVLESIGKKMLTTLRNSYSAEL